MCSRLAIASDTAGCDIASSRAAFAMLRDLATVDRMYRSRTRRRLPSLLSHSMVTLAIGCTYMGKANFAYGLYPAMS